MTRYSKKTHNLPKNSFMVNERQRVDKPIDSKKLTEDLIKLVEFVETPEMKELQKSNENLYCYKVDEQFTDFSDNYYHIFRLIVDDTKNRSDNLFKIIDMIKRINKIEDGISTKEKEFEEVKEQLAEEHLYPSFGGKENFIKALDKDLKK